MGWVEGKWIEGARCEDAGACSCCDVKELRGDYDDDPPEWGRDEDHGGYYEVDAGRWDDDPSPYGGTYSED